ncbi:MAG: hypothetical protein I3273_01905 [Candidatus Moeniiplasma glomeromycotorum]|nr:hypothetical protein [Candidatus Moeniiplasma glomeromycotorum]MCE8167126.1 hypothetical protein [Candidatus Moeniiplasma glomeromycotorum]MCE8168862.1 hypothetical protein [Candidatus Moeniiplasma glomeromycotorum]
MPTANLKNITIKELKDKNTNPYFLIVNNDNQDEAYFCFPKAVREGWTELANNWQEITEIELEYEVNDRGSRKVTGLKIY